MVADTAVSGPGTPEEESPLDTAVWRLRSRGCWQEAAALLAPYCADDPSAAVRRAALLSEHCVYTASGWEEAEEALRTAEALARTDEERGAAACERGHLAYAVTVMGLRDRSDEARSALGRSAALLSLSSANRPLLDFRRGLVAEHLSDNAPAAHAAYRRAHAGATAQGDLLLCSSTWRHLAGLALRDGDLAEAGRGFAESLRLREELGYLVGMAPALASLAEVRPEPEAGRLRAEAARLVRLLGGTPGWLAEQLDAAAVAEPPPAGAPAS